VFCVQLRDKRKDEVQLRAFAERLRAVTKEHGAWLLVNGNAQLAKDQQQLATDQASQTADDTADSSTTADASAGFFLFSAPR